MRERERFTQQEAEGKIDQRVRTLVEFSGVPETTAGQVTRADDSEIEEGGPGRTYIVGVQWELPVAPRQLGIGEIDGEPFIWSSGGKPLVDWFNKNEYEEFLIEIDDETNEQEP
jgi:hypothetical protein